MGTSTGDGSRPVTDGKVDNLGAGSSFNPSGNDGPAPKEKASEKRSDAVSVENDDSAPMGLTEDAEDIIPEHRREKPSDRER